MAECRPKNYPKLKDYKPSRFMLPTCHYDAAKADRAVTFIENLRHTKGKWAGKRFWLLPWQEQIIRDVFGIVDERGNRQFRTAYVEIGKKNGKSELAAAVALYLLFADNEPSAEVYGAAADRQQASIVFDVAHQMVQMTPALLKRCKIMAATKRIVNYGNAGFYQVLSAEVGTKHGLNVSGLVLDEVHAQPNRKLYDVLTKGSGDAREQPLFFLITTAGTDKESICYELHMKALDLLAGRKIDYTFYPVVYGLTDEDDWHDEANWYKANPSLGQTIQIQRVRDAYQEALDNPAEENVFKQLRLNMWVSSLTRFIPEHIYNLGSQPIDMHEELDGNGVLAENANVELEHFAFLFEFDGDQRHIRHVLYNCVASRPSIEGETNEDSKEVKTDTLNLQATPLANGYVKAKTGTNTTDDVYNKWYDAVYEPQAEAVDTEDTGHTEEPQG